MNKKYLCIVGLILITSLLMMAGCSAGTSETGEKTMPETIKKDQTASNEKDSPIKKVDFQNFSYPWTTAFANENEKTFAIKNGKLESKENTTTAAIGKIQYMDLTGDTKDEAIIDMGLTKGKDGKFNLVYVFTLENEKPKLLWSFDTGGDADGGLKAISSEKGNLLIEIFGDAKLVKGDWETAVSKEGAARKFTKTQLKWNGKEFAVEGKPEVLDIQAKT